MRWYRLIEWGVLCVAVFGLPVSAADISWTGSSGDWQDSGNWSSNPSLPSSVDNVSIAVPNVNLTVTHRDDDTTIRSLTIEDRLRIRSGSITVTNEIDVRPGSMITSDGDFVANGIASVDSATLNAGTASVSPGTISLPTLTNFATGDSIGWSSNEAGSLLDLGALQTIEGPSNAFRIFTIAARRGGQIDLGALTAVTRRNDSSLVKVSAEGAGTLIDLSSLGDLVDSGLTELKVVDQAEIKWGAAQIFDGVELTLGGVFPSSGLTTITNGSVAVEDAGGFVPDLSAVTNVDNSWLRAGQNLVVPGILALPNLERYSTSGTTNWTATDSESLLDLSSLKTIDGPDVSFRTFTITAARGSAVDLRQLDNVNGRNDTSLVRLAAVDEGSLIDLSGLNDLVGSGITDVTVEENAEIKWGNLEFADNVRFRLGGKFDTSNLVSATNGLLAAENGSSVAPDLARVSNADSSWLRAGLQAVKPGQLLLPGLLSYSTSESGEWTAVEPGSLLDLSALQTINGPDNPSQILSVLASEGGRIDLGGVTKINQRNATSLVKITATGEGSSIDLSAIPDLTDSGITDVSVLEGGRIELGSLVTADGVNFRLGGILDTRNLTAVTNGSISAENGAFEESDLSKVADVDNSSLTAGLAAFTSGRLRLPSLQTYSTEGSQIWTSTEVSSVLDLSAMQTINGPSIGFRDLTITASRGGRIDLPNVTAINRIHPDSKVNVLANGSGSIIELQSLTQSGGVSVIEADDLGQVVLGTLEATAVEIAATEGAQIVANRITLGIDTVLTGEGIAGSVTNRAGRIQITESSMEIAGQYFHDGGELTIPATKSFVVGTDYDNSQFGSGNDFQHRGGIPGEGELLAVSAGQELTGAVVNGASTTPRISLGNVHVGKTLTATYGVKNTGTSTSLRGATKTTFAGSPPANDLLSGVGAGGDFGPVLPGETQELPVSVSPVTAGPIPEQQVLIDNNFDNVDTQIATFFATAYRLAEPGFSPGAVDFGIVHVGDELTPFAIAVSNNVLADEYSESLNVTPRVSGDVLNVGSAVIGLAPQDSSDGQLLATLDTSTSGFKSGAMILDFDSNGDGTSELGLTRLSSEQIAVAGQVNDYAKPTPVASGDAVLAQTADRDAWVLDFGVVFQGLETQSVSLDLLNAVVAPADELAGTWSTTGAGFDFEGFANFENLIAGERLGGNVISISSDELGQLTGSVSLLPRSENETGFSQGVDGLEIGITAEVVVRGDFDNSQTLELADIDLLTEAVSTGSTNALYDVDLSGAVGVEDITFWVTTLRESLLGDTDLNGTVEFADFLALSGGFGLRDTGWSKGDFDGNGATDFADFLTLSGNFGQSAGAGIAAVPEPAWRGWWSPGLVAFFLIRGRRIGGNSACVMKS